MTAADHANPDEPRIMFCVCDDTPCSCGAVYSQPAAADHANTASYAEESKKWTHGQKSEDELLQRIWNLAADVTALVAQAQTAVALENYANRRAEAADARVASLEMAFTTEYVRRKQAEAERDRLRGAQVTTEIVASVMLSEDFRIRAEAAADECKRLDELRGLYLKTADEMGERAEAAEADRDEAERLYDEAEQRLTKMEADRDRLADALQRIENNTHIRSIWHIARAALARTENTTTKGDTT